MRPNRLRQLLNEGKPSIGHHVTSTSPDVVEIIGRAGGVDYLEFVAEYMPYDLYSLDNFGRALELTGMSGMIKIDQENKAYTANRAIGSGIQNILFSDTRTVEEARSCVHAVRAETPQTGGGFGAADRRFAGYGLESASPGYVQALEDGVLALMIEKREAVENLEEILSIGGDRYGRLRRQRLLDEHRQGRPGGRPRRPRPCLQDRPEHGRAAPG